MEMQVSLGQAATGIATRGGPAACQTALPATLVHPHFILMLKEV